MLRNLIIPNILELLYKVESQIKILSKFFESTLKINYNN